MNNTVSYQLQVFKQEIAYDYLEKTDFINAWIALYQQCSWSTGYQSVEYCVTWYRMFNEKFSPLLLVSYDENKHIIGLFALAQSVLDNTKIVIAGNQHPEYRIWLALPEHNDKFILQVLTWLKKNCTHPLALNYLPHRVDMNWLKWTAPPTWHCVLNTTTNHHLRIGDKEWLKEYMRGKKRLKTKFNKMQRMGEILFKRVVDVHELDNLLNQIIPLYEFRQGAVHGSTPFHTNPLKRAFTLELLKQKRLHASVLIMNGEVLGALLSVCGRGQVHLGEIAYSTFHPDLSPGLIHLWLLVPLLAAEGFEVLDLTPGGDSYKSRFANETVELYELTFYPRLWQTLYPKLKKLLKPSVTRLKSFFSKQLEQESNPSAEKWRLVKSHYPKPNSDLDVPLVSAQTYQKNSLNDLLCFQAKPSETDREDSYFMFLRNSFNLITLGADVYTVVEDNQLKYAVWIINSVQEHQLKFLPEQIKLNEACVLAVYPSEEQDASAYQKALYAILPTNKKVHILEK